MKKTLKVLLLTPIKNDFFKIIKNKINTKGCYFHIMVKNVLKWKINTIKIGEYSTSCVENAKIYG